MSLHFASYYLFLSRSFKELELQDSHTIVTPNVSFLEFSLAFLA